MTHLALLFDGGGASDVATNPRAEQGSLALSATMQSKASDRLTFCSIVCEVCTLQPQGILQDETKTNEKSENRSTFRTIFPYTEKHVHSRGTPCLSFCGECGRETELDRDRLLLLGVSRALAHFLWLRPPP